MICLCNRWSITKIDIILSRRFRALKLWLVLRCHGLVNHKNFIRSHIKMATHFEGLISMDERFEILVPRSFPMVCFRVSTLALQKKAWICWWSRTSSMRSYWNPSTQVVIFIWLIQWLEEFIRSVSPFVHL